MRYWITRWALSSGVQIVDRKREKLLKLREAVEREGIGPALRKGDRGKEHEA